MERKYLVILEVSQKQAFIFSSNKLEDNIINSAIIAWVTDSDFFEKTIGDSAIYSEEKNLVYTGGGHTVLVFDTREQAKEFVWRITKHIYITCDGLEVFATILDCEEEIGTEKLKQLSQKLERKKSRREVSFHQRSFGVEERKLDYLKEKEEKRERIFEMREKGEEILRKLIPNGFEYTRQMGLLGGSEGEANFVAVIHIDGNSMGKRVKDLQSSLEGKSWSEYRDALKIFSNSVDRNFKEAYKEMANEVADLLMLGGLKELHLKTGEFPIRPIILAGDDVCFITEGRIGLECARIFIEKLVEKENDKDKQHYAACAGVAIVHQKYPFYRAYELAEELCSNAKRFIANTYRGLHPIVSGNCDCEEQMDSTEVCANVCAIDWHIEYGEMKDGLEEIREGYQTVERDRREDGIQKPQHLELRPYILLDPKGLLKGESIRNYGNFRKLIKQMQTGDIDYARGKLKEFRRYLKEGEMAATHYIKTKQIDDLELLGYQDIFVEVDYSKISRGEPLERRTFVQTVEKEKRCLYFDAIELLDTFIPIER